MTPAFCLLALAFFACNLWIVAGMAAQIRAIRRRLDELPPLASRKLKPTDNSV